MAEKEEERRIKLIFNFLACLTRQRWRPVTKGRSKRLTLLVWGMLIWETGEKNQGQLIQQTRFWVHLKKKSSLEMWQIKNGHKLSVALGTKKWNLFPQPLNVGRATHLLPLTKGRRIDAVCLSGIGLQGSPLQPSLMPP